MRRDYVVTSADTGRSGDPGRDQLHSPQPLAAGVTLRQALAWAIDLLGLEEERATARLEAEVLLCHQLRINRARLYSCLHERIDDEELRRFGFLVERRAAGEPVSYVIGHKEFFGLDFLVDRRVLIPRPETELLVETALEWLRSRTEPEEGWLVADVGTGCGAVAVSIAANQPRVTVFASDVSPDALELAHMNSGRHGLQDRISLRQGDLLSTLPFAVDVVVANLPYIPHDEIAVLPRDIRDYEPYLALDGGDDGLDHYRSLIREAPSLLKRGGLLACEFGIGQGNVMLRLAQRYFPAADVALLSDLSGRERVLRVNT